MFERRTSFDVIVDIVTDNYRFMKRHVLLPMAFRSHLLERMTGDSQRVAAIVEERTIG